MYQHVAAEEVPLEVLAPKGSGWLGLAGKLGATLSSNRKAFVGVVLMALFVITALFAPLIAPYDPTAGLFQPFLNASHDHLLGTTSDGKDVFSQLVWGTRQSLVIALVAGLFATIISVLIGITSAYLGGIADHVLSLFTDIFLVLPALPLMIVIAAYFKGSGAWVIIAVIVITGWSFGARQLRSQALSLRSREFLESARVRGENSLYIILFELLPTMISLIAANFLGAALYSVLAAAGLQFIGLGNPDDISWGTMLYFAENNEALASGAPLWAITPGVCIALLGASFALLNYAFDEIGNPALRTARRKRGKRAAHSRS
jgi:peptide/nickel transport system permease protein